MPDEKPTESTPDAVETPPQPEGADAVAAEAEVAVSPSPLAERGPGGEVPEPEPDLDIALDDASSEDLERLPEPCDDAPDRLIVCGNPVGHPRVFISYPAVKQILAHVRSDTSREIGGVLIGRHFESKHGLCTQITGALTAENTEAGLAHVTFSHDTWTDIYRRLDEQEGDAKIVGWYHSHPGFGIFLSNQDMFIQRNFFTAPGQVAIVVDPIGERWGAFRWVKGEVKPAGGFWVFAEAEEQVEAAHQLMTSLTYALTVHTEPGILEKMARPLSHLADGVAGWLGGDRQASERRTKRSE